MGILSAIRERFEDTGCDGIIHPALPIDADGLINSLTIEGFTQRIQTDLPPKTVRIWNALAHDFPELDGLGAWGDRSHQSRVSDHNYNTTQPGKHGPLAVDAMTKNAALQTKVVAWCLANRVKYGINLVINQRKKWSRLTKWLPVKYFGKSPHADHVHISIDG